MNFSTDTLIRSSQKKLVTNETKFGTFIGICNKILDEQSRGRKKHVNVKENQLPFINKTLSKTVILRRKSKTIFLKNRSEEIKLNYRKQRNVCVKPLTKSEWDYYSSLNEKKYVTINGSGMS